MKNQYLTDLVVLYFVQGYSKKGVSKDLFKNADLVRVCFLPKTSSCGKNNDIIFVKNTTKRYNNFFPITYSQHIRKKSIHKFMIE